MFFFGVFWVGFLSPTLTAGDRGSSPPPTLDRGEQPGSGGPLPALSHRGVPGDAAWAGCGAPHLGQQPAPRTCRRRVPVLPLPGDVPAVQPARQQGTRQPAQDQPRHDQRAHRSGPAHRPYRAGRLFLRRCHLYVERGWRHERSAFHHRSVRFICRRSTAVHRERERGVEPEPGGQRCVGLCPASLLGWWLWWGQPGSGTGTAG